MKTNIIAEIGWDHLGNIKLAEKFIKSAANHGADYCKFQTWSVKNLKMELGIKMEEEKFMKKLN